MDKIDLKKTEKQFYAPKKEPAIVEIPRMNFLMVDGKGDPNTSQEYTDAVQVLYSLSYTLKFYIKHNNLGSDYTVLPLEGLWWIDDMEKFKTAKKDDWLWTAMIRQPDFITQEQINTAIDLVRKKNNPTKLESVRFKSFTEGSVVQVMYIGPYSDEGPTIEKMHQFAVDNGYRLRDKHHEIYLSDPRRAKPEKLKTVIRQPVTK